MVYERVMPKGWKRYFVISDFGKLLSLTLRYWELCEKCFLASLSSYNKCFRLAKHYTKDVSYHNLNTS